MAEVRTDYAIVEAMRVFGGSFIKTLATLCDKADPDNLAKIKATWPEYWAEYTRFADIRYENGDGPA